MDYYGNYGGYPTRRQPARSPRKMLKIESTKWRVCSTHPICVETDADKMRAEIICDLEPRTIIDVCEEKQMPDGSTRVSKPYHHAHCSRNSQL